MKNNFLFIVLFIFVNSSYTEIIDGPANARDLKTNEVLVSLFNNINLDCYRIEENYFKLQIWGISNIQNTDDFVTLFKGDTLFSLANISYPPDYEDELRVIPIGIIINTFNADIYDNIDTTHAIWYFSCKTHKNNFKRNSVPELSLEDIIKHKKFLRKYYKII